MSKLIGGPIEGQLSDEQQTILKTKGQMLGMPPRKPYPVYKGKRYSKDAAKELIRRFEKLLVGASIFIEDGMAWYIGPTGELDYVDAERIGVKHEEIE